MARLYADENFPWPAVQALRAAGHDVVTLQETGHGGRALAPGASEALTIARVFVNALVNVIVVVIVVVDVVLRSPTIAVAISERVAAGGPSATTITTTTTITNSERERVHE